LINTGNVGIGTTSPTAQLELSTDSAKKPTTNTWTIASDARIKTAIRPFTDGLQVIQEIRPVWYQYNGKAGFPADGREHIGKNGDGSRSEESRAARRSPDGRTGDRGAVRGVC